MPSTPNPSSTPDPTPNPSSIPNTYMLYNPFIENQYMRMTTITKVVNLPIIGDIDLLIVLGIGGLMLFIFGIIIMYIIQFSNSSQPQSYKQQQYSQQPQSYQQQQYYQQPQY